MSDKIRLDRFLAEAGVGTRSEVKKLIRAGRVRVVKKMPDENDLNDDEGANENAAVQSEGTKENAAVPSEDAKENAAVPSEDAKEEAAVPSENAKGEAAVQSKSGKGKADIQSDRKIDPETEEVLLDERPVYRIAAPIIMMNKPAGVVSATKDTRDVTVLDLILEPWEDGLFPMGRLDKDTEGLLLLTADGKMSHELLSPKKHVKKTYFAVVSGAPDPELVERFREGLDIGDKKLTLPAELAFIEHSVPDCVSTMDLERCREDECCTLITITEGRFHQIKRMFAAVGREVRFLKRISMAGLTLDPALEPGQYRPLTEDEEDILRYSKWK